MAEDVADVTLTAPSGATRTLKLAPTEPGVWQTSVSANELGLWRATDGKLNALVNIGPANPREFAEVTSTTEVLGPIATATGGDSRRLDDGNGLDVPRILAVRSGDTYKGDDWIGLKMRDASVVRGIGVLPVFAGLLGLLLLLGSPRRNLGARGPLRRRRYALSHSGRIRPDTPAKAPSTSSATKRRAGSTGPGMLTRAGGDRPEAAFSE